MLTKNEMIERNGVHGVAVVSGGGKVASSADQGSLLPVYLVSMRQRFKNEINRLTTRRAMFEMLGSREDAIELSFPMSYLYAWYWLRHNVHIKYMPQVLETFRGAKFGFLMDLLLSDTAEEFIDGYIQHWQSAMDGPKQQSELLHLLKIRNNNAKQLADDIASIWQSFGLFTENYMVQFKQVSRDERDRYQGMLGAEDLERLALVDALPDSDFNFKTPRYSKLGIIPAMGCPQTCRHCMFTWRPPRGKNENPQQVFDLVDQHTDSVLFTGGDLTKQLDYFYVAIRTMRHIKNFAILLNGDFATTAKVTNEVMGKMAEAVKSRPKKWPKAMVLLQISFDEFHQEVYVDKQGLLAERIPVAKIANIVERYPKYAGQIQLALLHKQTGLNFSHDVLNKGVVARLAAELTKRGYQMQVVDMKSSPRLKVNPVADHSSSQHTEKVLKDVTFVLDKHTNAPILLTSSTIDGYGRAALLDEWETVKEKDLLQQVITQGPPPGESFDIDMMLWFNGWVTLFNAVHICLGDHYKDGMETIMARQRKDPLSHALNKMDRCILDLYSEIRDDLKKQIEAATGPHHLFHALTEEPEVRLHLTRRLIEENKMYR
jgi:hypothetical protein